MDWTAISVFVAASGIVYTARLRRTLSRKQHTLNCIMQATFNDEYIDSLRRVSRMMRKNDCPPPLGEDQFDDIDLSSDVTALKSILNYWEFLCAGLRNGDIDEKILFDTRGGSIRRGVVVFREYIEGRREVVGSEALYEHIEWFYDRHSKPADSFVASVLEWMLQKPISGRRAHGFSYRQRVQQSATNFSARVAEAACSFVRILKGKMATFRRG